jgi:hypothetical protein
LEGRVGGCGTMTEAGREFFDKLSGALSILNAEQLRFWGKAIYLCLKRVRLVIYLEYRRETPWRGMDPVNSLTKLDKVRRGFLKKLERLCWRGEIELEPCHWN